LHCTNPVITLLQKFSLKYGPTCGLIRGFSLGIVVAEVIGWSPCNKYRRLRTVQSFVSSMQLYK